MLNKSLDAGGHMHIHIKTNYFINQYCKLKHLSYKIDCIYYAYMDLDAPEFTIRRLAKGSKNSTKIFSFY